MPPVPVPVERFRAAVAVVVDFLCFRPPEPLPPRGPLPPLAAFDGERLPEPTLVDEADGRGWKNRPVISKVHSRFTKLKKITIFY
jgi:hypothetical protein